MSYSTGPIPNLRTIKAIRGESLTIDLGKVFPGTLESWMKKDPNSDTFRSFNIVGNRYLQLPSNKAKDYLDVNGVVIEAVKGKWFFDVEQILDPEKPEEVTTIYKGTIVFSEDITNSSGTEILDPAASANSWIGLIDTPIGYGTTDQIVGVNGAGTALIWVDRQFDDTETANVKAHLIDTANPHSVTQTQVGLPNVNNTSDVNKPISTATQTALDLKSDKLFIERFSATAGQVSHTVGAGVIVDNGLYEVQVSGQIWNSRTGIISFTGGNISINFATGEITFHYPLSLDTQVIIKHN